MAFVIPNYDFCDSVSFYRRKDLYYTHHLITTIHLHALIFSILILRQFIRHLYDLFPLGNFSNILDIIIGLLFLFEYSVFVW